MSPGFTSLDLKPFLIWGMVNTTFPTTSWQHFFLIFFRYFTEAVLPQPPQGPNPLKKSLLLTIEHSELTMPKKVKSVQKAFGNESSSFQEQISKEKTQPRRSNRFLTWRIITHFSFLLEFWDWGWVVPIWVKFVEKSKKRKLISEVLFGNSLYNFKPNW